MSDPAWRPIAELPNDWDRPGGRRTWRMRDAAGREVLGKQAYFNDSGYIEAATNREIWPVAFADPEQPSP